MAEGEFHPLSSDLVRLEIVERHIAVVTLDRPGARHAMTGAMSQTLAAIVRFVETGDIRVGVLTSTGDQAFCAGADLKDLALGKGFEIAPPGLGFGGFVDVARSRPWIAAVAGPALGGGCELALACDVIVAARSARFGLPEVQRGLFAGAGGVHRLVRVLPRNIALGMIVSGEPMGAAQAHAWGMVNLLAETAPDVLPSALALARRIAANAPLSVRESLALARIADETPDGVLRGLSAQAGDRLREAEDRNEGLKAFAEKRTPVFRGR